LQLEKQFITVTHFHPIIHAADGPIIIYGAILSVLAAAAADDGDDVLVIEPLTRISGMSTNVYERRCQEEILGSNKDSWHLFSGGTFVRICCQKK